MGSHETFERLLVCGWDTDVGMWRMTYIDSITRPLRQRLLVCEWDTGVGMCLAGGEINGLRRLSGTVGLVRGW